MLLKLIDDTQNLTVGKEYLTVLDDVTINDVAYIINDLGKCVLIFLNHFEVVDNSTSEGLQYTLKAEDCHSYHITVGKEYKTLKGIEEGMYSDSPYVTFMDDSGKKATSFLSRFAVVLS
jgi:hypothetical protein